MLDKKKLLGTCAVVSMLSGISSISAAPNATLNSNKDTISEIHIPHPHKKNDKKKKTETMKIVSQSKHKKNDKK